jgi:hypothetical protein
MAAMAAMAAPAPPEESQAAPAAEPAATKVETTLASLSSEDGSDEDGRGAAADSDDSDDSDVSDDSDDSDEDGRGAAADSDDTCIFYIVLHGESTSVKENEYDEGELDSKGKPNFFEVPENCRIHRYVPPGHVFMSGPDDNRDIREFIADGGNLHAKYSIRANPELFAVPHGDIVPVENEKTISYRKLLSSSFQTFNSGDIVTNEDLLSDWSTAEDRYDFGIWFLKENGTWEKMIEYSNEIFVNMSKGKDKEIKISELINNIMTNKRKKTKRCTNFIFHFANCSPITMKKNKNRKLKKIGSIWKRKGNTYKSYSDEYWYNKLFLTYKRILHYSIGKQNSNQIESKQDSGAGAEAVLNGESTPSRMEEEERAELYAHFNEWYNLYNKFNLGTEEDKERAKKMSEIYKYVIAACTTPYHKETNLVVKFNGSIIPIYGTSQVTLKKKLPSGEIIHPTHLQNNLLKIYRSKVKGRIKKIPTSKMEQKYTVNTYQLGRIFPWLDQFFTAWKNEIKINLKGKENTQEYHERIAYQLWMLGESTFEFAGKRLLDPKNKIIPDEFEKFVYNNENISAYWRRMQAQEHQRKKREERRQRKESKKKTLKKKKTLEEKKRRVTRKVTRRGSRPSPSLLPRRKNRSRSRSRSRGRSKSKSRTRKRKR